MSVQYKRAWVCMFVCMCGVVGGWVGGGVEQWEGTPTLQRFNAWPLALRSVRTQQPPAHLAHAVGIQRGVHQLLQPLRGDAQIHVQRTCPLPQAVEVLIHKQQHAPVWAKGERGPGGWSRLVSNYEGSVRKAVCACLQGAARRSQVRMGGHSLVHADALPHAITQHEAAIKHRHLCLHGRWRQGGGTNGRGMLEQRHTSFVGGGPGALSCGGGAGTVGTAMDWAGKPEQGTAGQCSMCMV